MFFLCIGALRAVFDSLNRQSQSRNATLFPVIRVFHNGPTDAANDANDAAANAAKRGDVACSACSITVDLACSTG